MIPLDFQEVRLLQSPAELGSAMPRPSPVLPNSSFEGQLVWPKSPLELLRRPQAAHESAAVSSNHL